LNVEGTDRSFALCSSPVRLQYLSRGQLTTLQGVFSIAILKIHATFFLELIDLQKVKDVYLFPSSSRSDSYFNRR